MELLTPGFEVCVPRGTDSSGLFAISGWWVRPARCADVLPACAGPATCQIQ